MIWGYMTQHEVGYAAKINDRMNGDFYLQISKDKLLNTIQYYGFNPFDIIFHQNNNLKYICIKVKKQLKEQKFKTMMWPTQSPDLNLIEHLWGYLKRKLVKHENPFNGIYELWKRIQVDWEEILAKDCQKLIESMPKRVQAVLKAKGSYIKYQIYPNISQIFAYYYQLKNFLQ